MSLPAEPDVSRRGLTMNPVMWALVAVAGISLLFWLFTRNEPQLMIALAILLAGALDAASARLALSDLRLEVQGPGEAIAGRDVGYYARAIGMRRPVEVSRPGTWAFSRVRPIIFESEAPGLLTLEAPPRGVIRFLVFDLVAHGPLGLFECTRRLRVWLPTPMFIGPPPLEHDIDWPRRRSIRFGDHEIARVGDDLFRGTRPYVRGDTQRSIHWPATAHHGALMVKETDGLGIVALRIVVHLAHPGVASEMAAARAAWLAEEAGRMGWLVQLVTLQDTMAPPRPPPLGAPRGPLPLSPPTLPRLETTDRRVRTRGDITRQLAAAGFGLPTVGPWQGITCVVSPWGDEWTP